MSKPEYIRQFSLSELEDNPRFVDEVIIPDATAQGVTFARLSWRDDLNIALYEGWKVQPLDQGEIRWMLVYGEAPIVETEAQGAQG